MQSKRKVLSNFSRAVFSESECLRADHEEQLTDYLRHNQHQSMLVRGSGLSYNDSCFNSNAFVIDSKRLNHFLSFDSKTGIVNCQAGVLLKDLFLLHPDFIPPVLPGTLYATVAGAIAHDVHGKNNHQAGSFGQHVLGFDLVIADKKIHCSREEHRDLFYATIAGLGLTGVITRVTLRLKKISPGVLVEHKQLQSIKSLTELMATDGLQHDYQVAWLDLLHSLPRSVLTTADHCGSFSYKISKPYTIPPLPFGLLKKWNMRLFNQYFFNRKQPKQQLSLQQFNNPLNQLINWNRLYGPKGLIQFQAVFGVDQAAETLEHLLALIRRHRAVPTLAVLKLFSQSGEGLLSFCQPGFTLAVDFMHNEAAKQAIMAMNQLITELKGRVYCAKDLLLTAEQYQQMYTEHEKFSQILQSYHCKMQSDLAKRLGITTWGKELG